VIPGIGEANPSRCGTRLRSRVIAIRRQHGLESERFDRVTVTMAHARRSECSFTSRPKDTVSDSEINNCDVRSRCKVANSRPNQTGHEFGQEVIEQRAIT
jgi:hypothetical protein